MLLSPSVEATDIYVTADIALDCADECEAIDKTLQYKFQCTVMCVPLAYCKLVSLKLDSRLYWFIAGEATWRTSESITVHKNEGKHVSLTTGKNGGGRGMSDM